LGASIVLGREKRKEKTLCNKEKRSGAEMKETRRKGKI